MLFLLKILLAALSLWPPVNQKSIAGGDILSSYFCFPDSREHEFVPGMSYFQHGLQNLCHIKLEDVPWNDEQIIIINILNWNFRSSF